jgi:hypothetical protein
MMDANAQTGLSAQIAAAMSWWREAGVDCDFSDEPRNWIVAPEEAPADAADNAPAAFKPPPPPAPPPAEVIGGDRALWPQDAAQFAAWWLSEPTLDGGQLGGRVPPRGNAGAEVMILVAEPEVEDTGRLLSGPQGRLLDAMLAAMGLSEDRIYVASALPRHMPLPDWAALQAGGLGEILAHHVSLVAPKRLIVFSNHVSALLGNDPANNRDLLRSFNHEGSSVPLLAGRELAMLLGKPRIKAGFWQRWLDWAA